MSNIPYRKSSLHGGRKCPKNSNKTGAGGPGPGKEVAMSLALPHFRHWVGCRYRISGTGGRRLRVPYFRPNPPTRHRCPLIRAPRSHSLYEKRERGARLKMERPTSQRAAFGSSRKWPTIAGYDVESVTLVLARIGFQSFLKRDRNQY